MRAPILEEKDLILRMLDEAYETRVRDLGKSESIAYKALEKSKLIDDPTLIGKALSQLSLFKMITGSYEASVKLGEEAIVYFDKVGDEKGIADAKFNIASVYYKTDNFHLGLTNLIHCAITYRKFHDYHSLAKTLKSLGTIYEYFGDISNAIRSYEEAIKASEKAGDPNLLSNVYNPLSGILLNNGKIDDALYMIENAIALKKKSGDIRGMAFSLYGRGKIYTVTGNFDAAESDLMEALKIHEKMGEKLGAGMAMQKLGQLYYNFNRFNEAEEILKKAIYLSLTYNITLIVFKSKYLLYLIYKRKNDPVKALDYLEKYLKSKESVINTQTLQVIENYEMMMKVESVEKESRLIREKAEILDKKNRAEEEARIKQEFLSTMSHEIRTPLNAIINIAQLLKAEPDSENYELIDSLKFASKSLLLLINDILDFTKLESGNVKLEPRPINIIKLVENIRNTYAGLAAEKGLTLNLIADTHLVRHYEIDALKLSQILGNLLINAIKFTEKGHVDLRITLLESNETDDLIRFEVHDTGIGIPNSFLDIIFESFTQPRAITTRKHGGTGLGLSIVKKLINLHQSDIEIETKEGKGSIFSFNIYLRKTTENEKSGTEITGKLNGLKVLMAEDNPINAMVATKLMSRWGVEPDIAKNGLEAIEKTDKRIYDIILMDIHMPEMNGFDATAHIKRATGPNRETPVFALTADITANLMEDHRHHFNGFLRKPIESEELFETLSQLV